MKWFQDMYDMQIRLTPEREEHIKTDHPEMSGHIDKIQFTLLNPDIVVRSNSDPDSMLYYKYYNTTPVGIKYLCVVVKIKLINDRFIITAYFTDTIKRGLILWKKK